MGSARRGETGEPRCPNDRGSAHVVTELGPNGSLPGEAWRHVPRMGRARCTAGRPGPHVGFTGGPGSAACTCRRSGSTADLGIPGGSSSPGAKLGRAHARVPARGGRANVGCARSNFPAAGPLRAGSVMGRAGGRGAASSAAGGPRAADAECTFVEPACSRVGASQARSLCTGAVRSSAGLDRLGRAGAWRRCAAADRRTVVGRSRRAGAVQLAVAGLESAGSPVVGRAQDRRARCSGRTVMVCAGRAPGRAAGRAGGRLAALGRAPASGSVLENPIVAAG